MELASFCIFSLLASECMWAKEATSVLIGARPPLRSVRPRCVGWGRISNINVCRSERSPAALSQTKSLSLWAQCWQKKKKKTWVTLTNNKNRQNKDKNLTGDSHPCCLTYSGVARGESNLKCWKRLLVGPSALWVWRLWHPFILCWTLKKKTHQQLQCKKPRVEHRL